MASSSGGANLRVRISADLADIKQGLGLLRGELAKVKTDAAKSAPDTRAWKAGIANIRQEIGNLVGAYVGLQSVAGGFRAIGDAIGRMNRIKDLRQITGIGAESLSKLAYAAKFGSTDIETLGTGITKLGKDMLSNKGLLAQFGIAVTDATGKARGADQVLLDLADVFAQLPDGVEKNALAAKLFGDRIGPGLVPFLSMGRQGIEDLGVEAEKTGNVLSDEAVDAAAKFNDTLGRLKQQAVGLANETAKRLLPSITGYAEAAFGAAENSNFAAEGGQFLSTALKGIAAVAIVVKNIVEGLVNVLAFLGESAFEVGKVIGSALTRNLKNLIGFISDVANGKNPITAFAERTKDSFTGLTGDAKSAFSNIRSGFSAMKDGLAESARDIRNIGKLFDDAAATAGKSTKGIKDGANQATPATQRLLETIRKLLGDEGEIDKVRISTALLQDEAKRALQDIDQQFDDKQIGIAAYYAQRVALQQSIIDLQIEQLQGELKVTEELDKRKQLEEQITILQRDRQQVAVTAAREQTKAEKALNEERGRALQQKFGSITGNLSATEQSVSAQMDAGTLGQVEGERRLQEVRQLTLEQLRALRAEQQAYMATLSPDSPEFAAAQQGLMQLDATMANVRKSQQQFRQSVEDQASGALGGFFNDLIDGAKSFQDAFRDLVRSFLSGVAQMIAQQLALNAVKAVGRAFGAAHGGGIAGQLRMFRNNIDPSVFGFAPRYHGGGIAGLQNNEVPAILQRGEVIRTQQQEAALQANLATGRDGGKSRVTTPIVAIGDDAVANALAGVAGENVVLTHVRNNWGGLSSGG